MNIYIHIGQQKTGSTSIQYFLDSNRSILKQRGFLYPSELGGFKQLYTFKEIDSLLNPHSKIYTNFQREISLFNGDNLILSEENLFALRVDLKDKFKKLFTQLFKEDKIHFIVYLRRQIDHIPSHYQEVVKGKVSLSIDKWISKKIKTGYYDYYERLIAWKKYFPESEFQIREFANFKNSDIRKDFLSILGISENLSQFSYSTNKMNESLDARSIELLRASNALFNNHKNEVSLKNTFREALVQLLKGDKLKLTKRQAKMVFEKCQDSNTQLINYFNLDDSFKEYMNDKEVIKTLPTNKISNDLITKDLINIIINNKSLLYGYKG